MSHSKAEFVVAHLLLLSGIMEEKPDVRASVLDAVFPPDYREKAQTISIEFVMFSFLCCFMLLTHTLPLAVALMCSVEAKHSVHGLHVS